MFTNSTGAQRQEFGIAFFADVSGEEKLLISHAVGDSTTTGAGEAPDRRDTISKYQGTGSITKVNGLNSDTGDYVSGSNVMIMGNEVPVAALGTNLQDNSLFVEKDTARRYWFDNPPSVTNQDIEWTNGSGVTISGNTVTATTNGWSNGIARSVQTISPSRGGGEIIGQKSLNYAMIGLSKDPYWTSGDTFVNGNYMMYHDGIYELGTEVDSFTAGSNSTNYKITMDSNGVVKYFVDNGSGYSEVYESTVTAGSNDEYYALATPYNSGNTVSGTITGKLPTTWNLTPTYRYSSTGWTATGGGAVATDNLTLALDTDGGQDQVNYDLTSISSDKFVLDFTLNFSRLTIGTNLFWFMGLVNSTNWIATNSTNHMGIFAMQESGTKTFGCSDGTGTWNGAVEDSQTWTPSTGVDYYFRLTKLSSTTYKVELFGDSARTTVTSTSDGTVSSMTDLRYLVFTGDNNSGAGNATFTISDLKFYDGVSSIN